MAQSNNDCERVRRPHRHERTMFAVATKPHATVVARGGRAPAARVSKGARPSASHPSDPFPRARFFALFETVRRSSDASARALDTSARSLSLTARCRSPPQSHRSSARARDLAVEQGGDVRPGLAPLLANHVADGFVQLAPRQECFTRHPTAVAAAAAAAAAAHHRQLRDEAVSGRDRGAVAGKRPQAARGVLRATEEE